MKYVAGYQGLYSVTPTGKVYSVRCGKYLKSSKNKLGYHQINLNKDGKPKCFRVHRLVAEAFIPNPSQYTEVNHIDGDKNNNSSINLEWSTRSENINHAYKLGLINVNTRSARTAKVFTIDNVTKTKKKIIERLKHKPYEGTPKRLSEELNIRHNHIYNHLRRLEQDGVIGRDKNCIYLLKQ